MSDLMSKNNVVCPMCDYGFHLRSLERVTELEAALAAAEKQAIQIGNDLEAEQAEHANTVAAAEAWAEYADAVVRVTNDKCCQSERELAEARRALVLLFDHDGTEHEMAFTQEQVDIARQQPSTEEPRCKRGHTPLPADLLVTPTPKPAGGLSKGGAG